MEYESIFQVKKRPQRPLSTRKGVNLYCGLTGETREILN